MMYEETQSADRTSLLTLASAACAQIYIANDRIDYSQMQCSVLPSGTTNLYGEERECERHSLSLETGAEVRKQLPVTKMLCET